MSKAAQLAAESEKDWSSYAGKEPTDLQRRFADWTIEKLGMTFSSKKEEAAFRDGIRLGTALRIPFQASPENQSVRAEKASEEKPAKAEKAGKGKKGKAEAEPEAKPAKGKKAAKATAAPAEPAEEPVAQTPAKGKPRKAAKAAKPAPF